MTTTRSLFALLPCAVLAAIVAAGCVDTGQVKITVQGNGVVRSNPAGIDCVQGSSTGCSADLGRTFALIAAAASGAHFDHWEGDDLCIAQALATVTVSGAPNREVECTAVFVDEAPANAQ